MTNPKKNYLISRSIDVQQNHVTGERAHISDLIEHELGYFHLDAIKSKTGLFDLVYSRNKHDSGIHKEGYYLLFSFQREKVMLL